MSICCQVCGLCGVCAASRNTSVVRYSVMVMSYPFARSSTRFFMSFSTRIVIVVNLFVAYFGGRPILDGIVMSFRSC